MDAVLIQNGNAIDYTPSADTAAGSIVILNGLAGAVKTDIPKGKTGALALHGVYNVVKGSSSFQTGDRVYWDGESSEAVSYPEDGILIGAAVEDADSDEPRVKVLLNARMTGPADAVDDVEEAGDDSENLIEAVNTVLGVLRDRGFLARS